MTLNPFKWFRRHVEVLENDLFRMQGEISYLNSLAQGALKRTIDAENKLAALAEYEQVKFVTTDYVPSKTKAIAVTQAEIDAEREREQQYADFRSGIHSELTTAQEGFQRAARTWGGMLGGAR
jgi:hypothetical protein